MFTGIVEETGRIEAIRNQGQNIQIKIKARQVLEGTEIGDSISVNGICLTVTKRTDKGFTADVMPETMRRSSLAHVKVQDKVNLERALRLSDRLGGHIVSGHIDGTGTIVAVTTEKNAIVLRIKADNSLLKYIIRKGSVALDGVSLTVMDAGSDNFTVSIIPHSAASTIIGDYLAGDQINIECDVIGKYVERLLFFDQLSSPSENEDNGPAARKQGLSMDFLRQHGF